MALRLTLTLSKLVSMHLYAGRKWCHFECTFIQNESYGNVSIFFFFFCFDLEAELNSLHSSSAQFIRK